MLEISELDQLRARLARLENAASKPRGSTNQVGAAKYLNRSEEWLRREHAQGRGPRRTRCGARGWSYTYDDLNDYREKGGAAASKSSPRD
jgi:hypothetical protein